MKCFTDIAILFSYATSPEGGGIDWCFNVCIITNIFGWITIFNCIAVCSSKSPYHTQALQMGHHIALFWVWHTHRNNCMHPLLYRLWEKNIMQYALLWCSLLKFASVEAFVFHVTFNHNCKIAVPLLCKNTTLLNFTDTKTWCWQETLFSRNRNFLI